MKVTFCDVYFQPPHTLFYATSSKIIPELHTSFLLWEDAVLSRPH